MSFSLRFRAAIVSVALLLAFIGVWHIATRSAGTGEHVQIIFGDGETVRSS